MAREHVLVLVPALALVLAAGCDDTGGGGPAPTPDAGPGALTVTRAVRTPSLPGCSLAGPMAVRSRGESQILAVTDDGWVRAFDAASGAEAWSMRVPAPTGYDANITAPPATFDDSHVVIAYQYMSPTSTERTEHRVAVIDLEARALDASFAELRLEARVPASDGSGLVEMLAANAFSRSALVRASVPDRTRGLVYVSYGNIRDIQPWHGWVLELDLDRWHDEGASVAISAVLLTTPETSCGTPGDSGADDMICGGGVWTPAGPKLWPTADGSGGWELVVPTGNGQLDLGRRDYANTLMRTGRGLAFDPGCDATACAGFDVHDPSAACVESCENLFIPRLRAGDAPLRPASGNCDGLSLFDCYARIDWDLGASSPARIEVPGGPTVVALPAKDGGLYLFDAAHFGRLYDRAQIADLCGTPTDTCTAEWAGMMITEPAVTEVDGVPVVLVATHMFDVSHPSGVVALRVVMRDGAPRLEPFWTAPERGTDEALLRFRRQPSRIALVPIDGVEHAVVIDVGLRDDPGVLYLVRVRDGAVVSRTPLDGNGQRYAMPLVDGARVWVSSCEAPGEGAGHLEAFDIRRE